MLTRPTAALGGNGGSEGCNRSGGHDDQRVPACSMTDGHNVSPERTRAAERSPRRTRSGERKRQSKGRNGQTVARDGVKHGRTSESTTGGSNNRNGDAKRSKRIMKDRPVWGRPGALRCGPALPAGGSGSGCVVVRFRAGRVRRAVRCGPAVSPWWSGRRPPGPAPLGVRPLRASAWSGRWLRTTHDGQTRGTRREESVTTPKHPPGGQRAGRRASTGSAAGRGRRQGGPWCEDRRDKVGAERLARECKRGLGSPNGPGRHVRDRRRRSGRRWRCSVRARLERLVDRGGAPLWLARSRFGSSGLRAGPGVSLAGSADVSTRVRFRRVTSGPFSRLGRPDRAFWPVAVPICPADCSVVAPQLRAGPG